MVDFGILVVQIVGLIFLLLFDVIAGTILIRLWLSELTKNRRECKKEAEHWARVHEEQAKFKTEQQERITAKRVAKERKLVEDAERWEWILQQRAAAAERRVLAQQGV